MLVGHYNILGEEYRIPMAINNGGHDIISRILYEIIDNIP